MNLRDEVSAVMDARIEQSKAVHRISQGIREGRQEYELGDVVQWLSAILGAQREAILRVAEEVDRLRRT
jgi:hypothetical protein